MKGTLGGLLVGLVVGAALGYGVATKATDPQLHQRADSLAASQARADTVRAVRAEGERRETAAVTQGARRLIAARDTASAAVARLADSLTAAAPDTCLPILEALDRAFAGYRLATDSALRWFNDQLAAEQARTVFWRDTAVVDLRRERDANLTLARDAIRSRDRRILRVALAGLLVGVVAGKVF